MGLSFFLDPRTVSAGRITFVGHAGNQAGFRAFFAFNPLTGSAIIAAFNTSYQAGHNETETKAARNAFAGFNALREQSFSLLN